MKGEFIMTKHEKTVLEYSDALQSLFMTGKADTLSETVTGLLIKAGIVGRVERENDNGENRITLFRRGYLKTAKN